MDNKKSIQNLENRIYDLEKKSNLDHVINNKLEKIDYINICFIGINLMRQPILSSMFPGLKSTDLANFSLYTKFILGIFSLSFVIIHFYLNGISTKYFEEKFKHNQENNEIVVITFFVATVLFSILMELCLKNYSSLLGISAFLTLIMFVITCSTLLYIHICDLIFCDYQNMNNSKEKN